MENINSNGLRVADPILKPFTWKIKIFGVLRAKWLLVLTPENKDYEQTQKDLRKHETFHINNRTFLDLWGGT